MVAWLVGSVKCAEIDIFDYYLVLVGTEKSTDKQTPTPCLARLVQWYITPFNQWKDHQGASAKVQMILSIQTYAITKILLALTYLKTCVRVKI